MTRDDKFRWGLIALLLIGTVVYFTYSKNNLFSRPYEVKAIFTGAPEVHTRTPVRVAGVEVGKVKKVERGPGRYATVTFTLKKSALPVHRDATVKIRPRLFFEGNFFLDLHPGTPSAPEIERGGLIPLSHTAVPVQLDQVLADFRDSTRTDIRTLIEELSVAVDKGGAEAVNRTLPHLAPLGRGLAQTSEALRGENEGDLAGTIQASERTARAIHSRQARLPALVTGLNRTARALAVRRSQLEASLPQLDATLREARPALAEVRRLVPPSRAFMAEVRPALLVAPPTLRLASPFLTQLDRTVRLLPPFLRQADPAFRLLARLEPRLVRVLRGLRPVTECLRRNAIPTLKKPVDDPPHTTGAPVYLDLARGIVGQASASQNFDGNGPWIRYHAGFGAQTITLGDLGSSIGPAVGLTPDPILGSRPRKPARQPPFRPDVPCVTQAPPNLSAATGPAPRQAKLRGVKPEREETTRKEFERRLRRTAAKARKDRR